MPIYEYRCNACDRKFEVLVLCGEERADIVCPHCKSLDVGKLFSSFRKMGSESDGTSSGSSSCASCTATSCKGCSG